MDKRKKQRQQTRPSQTRSAFSYVSVGFRLRNLSRLTHSHAQGFVIELASLVSRFMLAPNAPLASLLALLGFAAGNCMDGLAGRTSTARAAYRLRQLSGW